MTYFSSLRRGAEHRDLPFDITIEYMWEIYLLQNKKCALCDENIVFSRSLRSGTQTASLDRINSKLGYIKGNIQWVHKDINRLKMAMPQEKFIDLCTKVANTHKHHGIIK